MAALGDGELLASFDRRLTDRLADKPDAEVEVEVVEDGGDEEEEGSTGCALPHARQAGPFLFALPA